jgi:hypothetical protein
MGATFGSGTRPLWVSPDSGYTIRQYGLEVRAATRLKGAGAAHAFFRANELGTVFGLEMQLGAYYSEESPVMLARSPVPFEVIGSVGVAGRVLSVGRPSWLSLVFHVNPEAAWGGQHWWSDTPRLAIFGGPRLLFRLDDAGAELDYSFVPNYFTGSPAGIEVDRWEHRLSGSVAYGVFGVGLRHVIASERTKTPFPDLLRSHAQSTFAYLELRSTR